MDVILIECVVKGYHECGFTVTAGEIFFLEKIKSALILFVASANEVTLASSQILNKGEVQEEVLR